MPITKNQFNDERLIIICECDHPEHQLHIIKEDDTGTFVVQPFLETPGFFRRIVVAVKYIFGYKAKYGHFTDVCIGPKQIKEITDFLNGTTPE